MLVNLFKRISPLFIFISVFSGYYIMGKMAILLSIPPSFATAIWPSAGFALFVVLYSGIRYIPAIFLASYLLNFQANFNVFFDFYLIGESMSLMLIAFAVCLQAIIGSYLVKKYIKFPNFLEEGRDIIFLLILAGPVSCLISSTISISSLYLFGSLPLDKLFFSWFIWWVGDSMGVFIILPLLILLFSKNSEVSVQRKIYVAVPLFILLIVTVYMFFEIRQRQMQKEVFDFKVRVGEITDTARDNLDKYVSNIQSVKYFFESSDFVDRNEYNVFVDHFFTQDKGVKGIAWTPKIKYREKEKYERMAIKEGLKNFRIREISKDKKLVPVRKKEYYYPLFYLKARNISKIVHGFDVSSEKNRYDAMMKALRKNEVVATPRIILVNDIAGSKIQKKMNSSIVIYTPVYKKSSNISSFELRKKNLKGFAVGAFSVSNILISRSGKSSDLEDLKVSIFDISEGKESLLYTNHEDDNYFQLSDIGTVEHENIFDFAHRRWKVKYSTSIEGLLKNENWESWLILVIGFALSAMLSILILIVTGRSELIQATVNEKTLEIEFARHRSQIIKNIAIKSIGASSVEEVIQVILNLVCEYLKWPVGHAFIMDENGDMKSSKIWHIDKNSLQKYKFFKDNHVVRGKNIGDEVKRRKTSIYVRDITKSKEYPYLKDLVQDSKYKLRTLYAVPILIQGKVEAVVKFFSPVVVKKNMEDIEFIELICFQLKGIIERKKVEKLKDSFVSTVNHELRTPLTSIRGALGLIVAEKAGKIPQKAMNLIKTSYNNSERLALIINDILNIEKLESGQFEFENKELDVNLFLKDVIDANEPYGQKYKVKFEIDNSFYVENLKIKTDRLRLLQVFANLMSNAAKFSNESYRVLIYYKLLNNKVRFYVKDFGIGIPKEFQPNMFKKFSQADDGSTRKYEGTGLGLNITKKLIESMGGKIYYETEIGKGTCFYFDIPILD